MNGDFPQYIDLNAIKWEDRPVFHGCIDTIYCNNCKIKYFSTICVCGYWKCGECNGPTSLKKDEGEFRIVKV